MKFTPNSKIRIGVVNIQSGVAITKGYWQYLISFWKYFLPHSKDALKQVVDFINAEDLDIVTFSEIDGGSLRSNNINQLNFISRLTNLKAAIFFPTWRVMRIINHGNAIASKHVIVSSKNHRLSGNGEPRYLSESVIEIDKNRMVVFTTHLSFKKSDREKQMYDIIAILRKANGPIILTGDLNASKSEVDLLATKTGLINVNSDKTFPSWNPKKHLHRILISPELRIIKSLVPREHIFSDHLPLIVEIGLK